MRKSIPPRWKRPSLCAVARHRAAADDARARGCREPPEISYLPAETKWTLWPVCRPYRQRDEAQPRAKPVRPRRIGYGELHADAGTAGSAPVWPWQRPDRRRAWADLRQGFCAAGYGVVGDILPQPQPSPSAGHRRYGRREQDRAPAWESAVSSRALVNVRGAVIKTLKYRPAARKPGARRGAGRDS